MLFKILLDPFFALLNFIVSLLPELPIYASGIVNTSVPNFILRVISFFPDGFFVNLFLSVSFYTGVNFTWAVIEWIYKKIPGVD